MAKKRQNYSAEFSAEAVKLVVEQGMSATQAAMDLCIHGWIRVIDGPYGEANERGLQ